MGYTLAMNRLLDTSKILSVKEAIVSEVLLLLIHKTIPETEAGRKLRIRRPVAVVAIATANKALKVNSIEIA